MSKEDIKRELHNWIEGVYRPTHFLTIQLPENQKSESLSHFTSHLRSIMIEFERYLLKRHWNKKHLPFICFAESFFIYYLHCITCPHTHLSIAGQSILLHVGQ